MTRGALQQVAPGGAAGGVQSAARALPSEHLPLASSTWLGWLSGRLVRALPTLCRCLVAHQQVDMENQHALILIRLQPMD